jgi:hypothetical protein
VLLAGCLIESGPAARRGADVVISVAPAFSTQATAADIHHYVFKLYRWHTNEPADLAGSYTLPVASGTKAHFADVPPGQYKASAEAFSSTDDTNSITLGGERFSSETATVSGSGVSYSSGSSLAIPMVLTGGGLAPGDGGSDKDIHTYVVNKPLSVAPFTPVASTFIWIPQFTAYQLIVPDHCGGTVRFGIADYMRPAGYWVKTRPSAGVEDIDWARGTFGGFYAGKYEASHDTATAAGHGAGTALKVAGGMPPWVGITWDNAMAVCAAYDSHCALIGDAEWTALAVWPMINGLYVYGNDNNLASSVDASITFRDDTVNAGQTAWTGDGARAGWTGGVNLTAHNGRVSGVYDLVGNAREWTSTVGLSAVDGWLLDTDPSGILPPFTANSVNTLSTEPVLRLLGLPATLGSNDPVNFNQSKANLGTTSTKAMRGGDYQNAAGIWNLYMRPRTSATDNNGFRPILRY